MNKNIKHAELSRRQVMIGAAGLSFAFAFGAAPTLPCCPGTRAGQTLSPWISHRARQHRHHHVGRDRDGARVDDLAAADHRRGARCRLEPGQDRPAPPLDNIYGNPGFAGMMYTAGSNAVTSYYTPLRIVGAQVRRVLIDNAARKWGVPVEELTTEPNAVVHAKSGRKLSYGDIAAFAEVPAKAPEIKPDQLKKTADFRLIGKDVMRVELPKKVNGSAQYGIDIQVPGMLYGMVLRAPVEGSVPDKIDEAKVRAVPGVTAVVRLPHGVGVVADTAWAAFGPSNTQQCGDLDLYRRRLGLRQR